jgi:arsenate reductase-like glutaredoxin family protein
MPNTKVIAIKNLTPYFEEGDELTIIPILYEEDTLIRNEIWGLYKKDGTFLKILEKRDTAFRLDNLDIKKLSDKLYAHKGSYKDAVIETSDNKKYPASIVRKFETYFKKI